MALPGIGGRQLALVGNKRQALTAKKTKCNSKRQALTAKTKGNRQALTASVV